VVHNRHSAAFFRGICLSLAGQTYCSGIEGDTYRLVAPLLDEAMFPDGLEEHAHRLAHHASLAGDHAKAMRFCVMAGEAAAALHANTEGAMHYSRAIEAAKQLGVANEEIARLEAKRTALSVD
jgi:hypothetical protein